MSTKYTAIIIYLYSWMSDTDSYLMSEMGCGVRKPQHNSHVAYMRGQVK